MKIALLINSLQGAGAERVVLTLAKGFQMHGFHIEIICIEKRISFEVPGNIKIHFLTNKNVIQNNFVKLFHILFLGLRLRNLIRRRKISVVQSHLVRASVINVASRFFSSKHKCIIVSHNIVSHNLSLGLKGRIRLAIIAFFYHRSDEILCISNAMLVDFVNTFNNNFDYKLIYNPHDIHEIRAMSSEKINDFDFDHSVDYVISSGRLIERKRIKDIIDAVELSRRTNPNIELLILGEGPYKIEISNYIDKKDAGRYVHLLGFKPNPFKYIKNSSILTLASEREGLPNVLIESMICGTAVVSSDCASGPREIIYPASLSTKRILKGDVYSDYGVLFGIGDTLSLSKVISDLIKNPQKRSKLTKNASERIRTFAIDKIIEAHKSLLV